MNTAKQLSTLGIALVIGACAQREMPVTVGPDQKEKQSGAIAVDLDAERELVAQIEDTIAPVGASYKVEPAVAQAHDSAPVQGASGRDPAQQQNTRIAPGGASHKFKSGVVQAHNNALVRGASGRDLALEHSNRIAPEGASHTARPVDRENYLHYPDNGVTLVTEQPVSTFSVDVDTAGYANIRRMLVREGRLPPSDAVRLEEMINYFSYHYAAPDSTEQPFSINTELAPAPWSDDRYLLQIGLKGFEPAAEQRPPANLVFLIDVSGSMQSPDKLGLVKKSLRLLVNKMTAQDHIALAVYAGAAGVVLESTPGNERARILTAIDGLQAGGSTHGSAGIALAYQLAEQHRVEGGINRVLIASDGDMNVGTVSMEALKDLVKQQRESGIALTTMGFGSGNYNYALMEQLADVGNGNAAYIDSLKEAQKVLVNEMQSTLMTIASDVKIQVEFNPAHVSEYRLIGYENRLLAREDFTNDKVDAGDIGAGHSVTALYEIVLVGSPGERLPHLRYQQNAIPDSAVTTSTTGELAYVKLRYKIPGQKKSTELANPISRDSILPSLQGSSDDLRFAAGVAGFGQLLQGGQHTGAWSYTDALNLARGSRGQDPHGYRSEFVRLVELAQSISTGS